MVEEKETPGWIHNERKTQSLCPQASISSDHSLGWNHRNHEIISTTTRLISNHLTSILQLFLHLFQSLPLHSQEHLS